MLKKVQVFLSALVLLFTVNTIPVAAASPQIVWQTQYASLIADKFIITIDGREYKSNDSVIVHSDPGSSSYTTLEAIWYENGTEMRLFIYFAATDGLWRVTEMRTYNGQPRGDWLYYDGFEGNKVGQYSIFKDTTFKSKDGAGQMRWVNASLGAFLPRPIPSQGPNDYYLDSTVGGETIIVTTQPNTGYGVNVILKDINGNVTTNQNNIDYVWTVQQPELVNLQVTPLCAYGIVPPCPNINGQFSGKRVGQTKVTVTAKREGFTLASTQLSVAVVGSVPTISSSELEKIKSRLDQTENKVQDLEVQQTTLESIVNSIRNFLWKLFGYR